MPPRPLPLMLLPPSEGKAGGGQGPPWSPGSMAVPLDAERERVAAALSSAMRGSAKTRGALLGVKGSALAAATDANRAVRTAPTMPAIERYTGVLYEAMAPRTLTPAQRRRLGDCVLTISGLWGAVAPDDPIPDYKLKMGASLGRLGTLSTWWRASLSAAIAQRARGRTLWNLLPNEHRAACALPDDLPCWTVRFLDRRPDGSLVAVSHWNKSLKGALVRFLVAHPDAGPSDLAAWEHPSGYRYDPSLDEGRGAVTTLGLVLDP